MRSRIVIDIDATIVTCRSDKQDAAGTWKRSFGFHPLLAIDAERREVLAQLVRPGNAGSNTAADHAEVLALAIDALPEQDRAGHHWDDDPAQVVTEIVSVDLAARYEHQRSTGERLGASLTVTVSYDVAVEATGTQAGLDQAVAITRSGGRVLLAGGVGTGLQVPGELFEQQLDLVPAIGYSRVGQPGTSDVAASLLAANSEVAGALITHRFPLDAAAGAFATARNRSSGTIKVVLEP